VDLASAGKASDLKDLKARAYAMNTLLAAFPHLFPAETKPNSTPGMAETSAKPDVWEHFDDFYDLSKAAATAAFDASQANDMASFRTHAVDLRKTCDSCHAKYMASAANQPSVPK
jgi:cytochrome c556